jgi:hypothetical protein
VSRAEACVASTNNGLVRPFGDIDVATAVEVLLNSLDRINLRTARMNKIIVKVGIFLDQLRHCWGSGNLDRCH